MKRKLIFYFNCHVREIAPFEYLSSVIDMECECYPLVSGPVFYNLLMINDHHRIPEQNHKPFHPVQASRCKSEKYPHS